MLIVNVNFSFMFLMSFSCFQKIKCNKTISTNLLLWVHLIHIKLIHTWQSLSHTHTPSPLRCDDVLYDSWGPCSLFHLQRQVDHRQLPHCQKGQEDARTYSPCTGAAGPKVLSSCATSKMRKKHVRRSLTLPMFPSLRLCIICKLHCRTSESKRRYSSGAA